MKLSKSVIFLLSALALAFIGLVLFKDKLIVNKVGKVAVLDQFWIAAGLVATTSAASPETSCPA